MPGDDGLGAFELPANPRLLLSYAALCHRNRDQFSRQSCATGSSRPTFVSRRVFDGHTQQRCFEPSAHGWDTWVSDRGRIRIRVRWRWWRRSPVKQPAARGTCRNARNRSRARRLLAPPNLITWAEPPPPGPMCPKFAALVLRAMNMIVHAVQG